MATRLGPNSTITAVRSGWYYQKYSTSEFVARTFEYHVGDPAAPRESWAEGVTLFHNPFADESLPERFLPASSVISIREGYGYREVLGFHPLVASMVTEIPGAESPQLR